jgi:hypothetical protein
VTVNHFVRGSIPRGGAIIKPVVSDKLATGFCLKQRRIKLNKNSPKSLLKYKACIEVVSATYCLCVAIIAVFSGSIDVPRVSIQDNFIRTIEPLKYWITVAGFFGASFVLFYDALRNFKK